MNWLTLCELAYAFIIFILAISGLLVIASEYNEHRKLRKLEKTMRRVLNGK